MCTSVGCLAKNHAAARFCFERPERRTDEVESYGLLPRLLKLRALGGTESVPARADDALGQELVRRWRRGEQAAFAEIFRTYRSLVHGVLSHLIPHDPDFEDVVQQAFIEVFRSLHGFEGRSKLSSWIARVALNVGYHHLRRRRSRPGEYVGDSELPGLVDESADGDPESVLERREAARRVYAILETMAPKKRTVFILNDLQGLSQEEVAEAVGASAATVRTRLFYARKDFWKQAEKDPVLSRFAAARRSPLALVSSAVSASDEDRG